MTETILSRQAGAVAFAGGILGNFLRKVAVQMIEGLEAWWEADAVPEPSVEESDPGRVRQV